MMDNDQHRGAGITVTEVAKAPGIGRNLTYRLANTGDIPALRLGKWVIISCAAFE